MTHFSLRKNTLNAYKAKKRLSTYCTFRELDPNYVLYALYYYNAIKKCVSRGALPSSDCFRDGEVFANDLKAR